MLIYYKLLRKRITLISSERCDKRTRVSSYPNRKSRGRAEAMKAGFPIFEYAVKCNMVHTEFKNSQQENSNLKYEEDTFSTICCTFKSTKGGKKSVRSVTKTI
jgi:hypothetical protein